jgi:hypothetical protein
MSRLDRFLLSDSLIDNWKVSGQWVGDRDISDHCPVSFLCSLKNWGPKPFRVNNCWFEHPDFFSFVEKQWRSSNFVGEKAFVLKEKMKSLKEGLRGWNRDVFGLVNLNIDNCVKEINEIEEAWASDTGPLD